MPFKRFTQSKHFPFWMFTFAFLMGLILPVLIMDGMFMDGVLYASVSKNLANGFGTPWYLRFSEYGFAEHVTFHEHPPLIFWIQSIFFRLFGDSMYVERFYSFFTCIVTAFLMIKTWKLICQEDEKLVKMSWLSIFLWMLIPVSFWAYQNNIQENTLGVFSLLSVYFALKAMHLRQKIILYLLLSGFMIFCAGLGKGIPGLFTLGAPFFYWLLFRKFSFGKMVMYNLIVILVPAALLGLVLLIPAANDSLSIYFNDRLLGRIESAHTRDTHFYILQRLFWELLPILIVCTITLLVYRLKKKELHITADRIKMIAFLIIIGLCGSVPIMLTLVQKTFYFVGSLPFFGLAFALLIAPALSRSIGRINRDKVGFKVFKGFTVLAVVAVLVITALQVGKVSRNKEVIHDLYLVDDYIPEQSVINVHPSMHNEWDLRVYLVRYYNISMDFDTSHGRDYYLINQQLGVQPDSTYTLIDLPTKKYDLYKKAK